MTPVQFDTIDSLSSGTYDAHGTLTVTCTGSQGAAIAACVDLGQGTAIANAANQRLLIGPRSSRTLPIQIFQDAGLRRPWGSASQDPSLTHTGDGIMAAPMYLRLYVQPGAAVPGTYSAQFPVWLRYGIVTGYPVNCGSLGNSAAARASGKAVPVPIMRKH